MPQATAPSPSLTGLLIEVLRNAGQPLEIEDLTLKLQEMGAPETDVVAAVWRTIDGGLAKLTPDYRVVAVARRKHAN